MPPPLKYVVWFIIGCQLLQLTYLLRQLSPFSHDDPLDVAMMKNHAPPIRDVQALQPLHVVSKQVQWTNLSTSAEVRERYAAAVTNECPMIWLMWTTSLKSFGPRQYAVLQSLLYHHSCANITILSNTLVASSIPDKWRRSVHIWPYDDRFLRHIVEDVPEATAWVDRIDEWRKQPYFFSHLTDYLRFALLYRYGGFYTDFDALYMRSLMPFTNAVGWDVSLNCLWEGCKDIQRYYAPGVMVNWEANHPVLRCALQGFDNYDPSCHNCVGPRSMTRCTRKHSERVTILPQHMLYPISWSDISRSICFNCSTDSHHLTKLLDAYSLHLYGFSVGNREIDVNSPFGRVLALYQEPFFACHPLSLLKRTFWVTDDFLILDGIRFCSIDPSEEVRLEVSAASACLLSPTSPWPPHSLLELFGSVSQVNRLLQGLAVVPTTIEIQVKLRWQTAFASGVEHLHIRDLRRLVTVVSKTFGRRQALDRLVESVRGIYPGLPLLVADDGLRTSASPPAPGNVPVLDLPFDTGLSKSRNILVSRVTTPYFFITDDDFVFDFIGTNLEYLLTVMETSGYDIVGVKSPTDENIWGFDFTGDVVVYSQNASLSLEAIPPHQQVSLDGFPRCTRAGIVQNIFFGRTSTFADLQWDDRLKLGEHEDFFLRAKLKGTKIASCSSAWIMHQKDANSAIVTLMDPNRQRAHSFMRLALRKHRLSRLYSFGHLVVDDSTDPRPLSLCAYGWGGENCDRCAPGYQGVHCTECSPAHFGQLCKPCNCVHGYCKDGKQGIGCVCNERYFGANCSRGVSYVNKLPPLCEDSTSSWFSWGNGFRCVQDNGPAGERVGVIQVVPSSTGGGAGFSFTGNTGTKMLLISGWSRAVVPVGEGEPLWYSLDVDVHYKDGTKMYGVFAAFSTGAHTWEKKQVLIEPEKPIESVAVHFLFKEHTGLVRFALPALYVEE